MAVRIAFGLKRTIRVTDEKRTYGCTDWFKISATILYESDFCGCVRRPKFVSVNALNRSGLTWPETKVKKNLISPNLNPNFRFQIWPEPEMVRPEYDLNPEPDQTWIVNVTIQVKFKCSGQVWVQENVQVKLNLIGALVSVHHTTFTITDFSHRKHIIHNTNARSIMFKLNGCCHTEYTWERCLHHSIFQ